MKVSIVREGWPFIIGLPLLVVGVGGCSAFWGASMALPFCLVAAGLLLAFLLFHFRDPPRVIEVGQVDPFAILSSADGLVKDIELVDDLQFIGRPAVRVSVTPSPLDVHVNRCPMSGCLTEIKTERKTSDSPECTCSLHIHGERTECLVRQIVGPVVRRAVRWIHRGVARGQRLGRGERMGLLRLGSRLDIYLPAEDVDILVTSGERVYAGLTAIARVKRSVAS